MRENNDRDQRVKALFVSFGDDDGGKTMREDRANAREASGDYITTTLNVQNTSRKALSKAIAENDEVVFTNHTDPVVFPFGKQTISGERDTHYRRAEDMAGFLDQLILPEDKEKIKALLTNHIFVEEVDIYG